MPDVTPRDRKEAIAMMASLAASSSIRELCVQRSRVVFEGSTPRWKITKEKEEQHGGYCSSY
jgi:hypothetical protein